MGALDINSPWCYYVKYFTMKHKVPEKTIQRLFLYYRQLYFLGQQGVRRISSQDFAKFLSIKDSQLRKDLSYFGKFGKKGAGYDVLVLHGEIAKILNIEKVKNVCVVGMGNLGSALAAYKGFDLLNFKIVAVFDIAEQKVGHKIRGHMCCHIKELPRLVKEKQIKIAIITTPAAASQEVARLLENSGIKAILNFAPSKLSISPKVKVKNLDMAIELKTLSFFCN